MSSNAPYTTAAVAAGLLGGAFYLYKSYNAKPKLPTTWTRVGTLSNLYVYPIKSCAPVVVDSAECSLLGLKKAWLRDRIMMVVDEKNNFISARAYPELLLVQPSVKGSILTLQHPDMEPLHLNLAEVMALQKPTTALVWSVPVPVLDCGWEVSEWFSRLLLRTTNTFRMVYYASQNARTLRGTTNEIYKFTKNDTGALPDEVSFNIINEASIDDLNLRLEDCKVSHRNFRPNFVLKPDGVKAYEEDNWKFIKIGENIFEVIKPCTRCVLTTIDPETGVRNAKSEPLRTLKVYRQIEDPAARRSAGNSPMMGLQMALRSGPGGLITLNDDIYVA